MKNILFYSYFIVNFLSVSTNLFNINNFINNSKIIYIILTFQIILTSIIFLISKLSLFLIPFAQIFYFFSYSINESNKIFFDGIFIVIQILLTPISIFSKNILKTFRYNKINIKSEYLINSIKYSLLITLPLYLLLFLRYISNFFDSEYIFELMSFQKFTESKNIKEFLSSIFLITILLLPFIITYLPYLIEIKKLNKICASVKEKETRENIGKIFYSFKTERARLKYVEKVSEKTLNVTGEWENNCIPNIKNKSNEIINYKSSNLLVKLDEKWNNF